MTNPVILLGTQSNGETLPVQVDATGRLVAEGLQGPPGPAGDDGPPGGEFPLPPNPYEGAVLGWLNGGLAWISAPPVPIPEGLFGPIISEENGLVAVEGTIPSEVGNGVYLIQTDQAGNPSNPLWIQDSYWSSYCTAGGGALKNIENCFDGDEMTKGEGTGGLTFTPPSPIDFTSKVEILIGPPHKIYFNGIEVATSGPEKEWIELATGSGQLESLLVERRDNPIYDAVFYELAIDGKPLVNRGNPTLYRVNQKVNANTLLGSVTPPTNLTPGLYFLIYEQRVAPWVYFKDQPEERFDQLRI